MSPTKTTCLPPKGRPEWQMCFKVRSMASMRSALHIDTSSMISVSTFLSSSILALLTLPTSLKVMTLNGSPKKEWMVSPPALMAAMPVGARTIKFLLIPS